MREIRSEFTANLVLAVPKQPDASWTKPSTCKRPVAVKVSVITRVWRAIVGAL